MFFDVITKINVDFTTVTVLLSYQGPLENTTHFWLWPAETRPKGVCVAPTNLGTIIRWIFSDMIQERQF